MNYGGTALTRRQSTAHIYASLHTHAPLWGATERTPLARSLAARLARCYVPTRRARGHDAPPACWGVPAQMQVRRTRAAEYIQNQSPHFAQFPGGTTRPRVIDQNADCCIIRLAYSPRSCWYVPSRRAPGGTTRPRPALGGGGRARCGGRSTPSARA